MSFKNNKIIYILLFIVIGILFSTSIITIVDNSIEMNNKKDGIYLLGDSEENVEVFTDFVDKGIVVPPNYSFDGFIDIDTEIVGTYEIVYRVYNEYGSKVKELKRTLNVVDTTAPIYDKYIYKTYYVGIPYTVNDFLTYYKDNYDKKSDLVVSQSEFVFLESGEQKLEFTISDTSNNTTKINETIRVKFDFGQRLKYEYRRTPSKYETYKVIEKATNLDTGEKVRVLINGYREYVEGYSFIDSEDYNLMYVLRNESTCADYAKIQLSYNFLTKEITPMYYEVWKDGVTSYVVLSGNKVDNNYKLMYPTLNPTNTFDVDLDIAYEEVKQNIKVAYKKAKNYVEQILKYEVLEYNDIIFD